MPNDRDQENNLNPGARHSRELFDRQGTGGPSPISVSAPSPITNALASLEKPKPIKQADDSLASNPDAAQDTIPYSQPDKLKVSGKGWTKRKKRSTGLAVAILLLFGGGSATVPLLGPGQVVQAGQILQNAHFGDQEDAADGRASKVGRFILYKGDIKKTRMGIVGNKIADKMERKLNTSGIETGYKSTFGFFNGYVIDLQNPPTDLRGRSEQQIKDHYKNKYGVDVKNGSGATTGKLVIEGRGMSYFAQRALAKEMLRKAGYSKVPATVGSRLAMKRGNILSVLHPWQKLDKKILASVDARLKEWRKNRAERNLRGAAAITPATQRNVPVDGEGTPDPASQQNANDVERAASQTADEAQRASAAARAGEPGALSRLKSNPGFRVTAGTAGLAGVLCIAKAIVDKADETEETMVRQPQMRLGMEIVATAGAIMYGKGADMEQVGFLAKQLWDEGKKQGMMQAASFQDALGQLPTGVDIRPDLKEGAKQTFEFLDSPTVNAVCSTAGMVILGAVSLLGGPVTAIAGTVISAVALPHIIDGMSGWMSSTPVDVTAVGPELVNNAGYGVLHTANDAAISAAGVALSTPQVSQLRQIREEEQQNEFNEKSFAYKLLDPYDHRSALAQVISTQNPHETNAMATMAKMTASFSSVALKQLATTTRAADTSTYDYGFAKYGFSVQELEDERWENPFENADRAADILDGPKGAEYSQRATTCFGINITKGAEGWATSSTDTSPRYKDIEKEPGCQDKSEDWMRIRFFIFDSQVVESLACYEGEEDSCANVGFGATGAEPAATGDGTIVTGTTTGLARQILSHPNIKFQTVTGENAFKPVGVTGTQQACGKSVTISPILLGAILTAAQKYKMTLGVFAAGHSCGDKEHPFGLAVDINGVSTLDGSVQTPNNQLHFDDLNAEQGKLVSEFYSYLATLLPEGAGQMGQSEYFSQYGLPAPTLRPGVNYFKGDSNNHIHFDVQGSQ